jgi:hypothetical protein
MTKLRVGVAAILATIVVSTSGCSSNHSSNPLPSPSPQAAADWTPIATAGVKVLAPLGWTHATPAVADPNLNLFLVGPSIGGAPPSHFVVRTGQAPVTTGLTHAITSYEKIGTLRNPTTTWKRPRPVTVSGCKRAEELLGTYHAGDNVSGPLVYTLDVFLLRNDDTPAHLFYSSGGAISATVVRRLVDSMSAP